MREGQFVDDASRSVIARASLPVCTFAAFFFDYDLGGWPDIFLVNGNVDEDVGKVQRM
jgi:hypothetical protein